MKGGVDDGKSETSRLLPPPPSGSTPSVSGENKKSFYFLNRRRSSERESKNVELELVNNKDSSSGKVTETTTSWFNMSQFFANRYGATGPDGAAKPRKLPVKVEPKVFFANERTFLSWLHMSITLASISMAIIAFADANEWSQLYGICLMPVAIAFCIYALMMYIKRAGMIRRKDPGPYEDRVGPVVLASMLSLAILVNFIVKLYDISQ